MSWELKQVRKKKKKKKKGSPTGTTYTRVLTGEYIQPTIDLVPIVDSWRGVQPIIHYSVSPEDILIDPATDTLPDRELLLEQGYKKGKLRAHSDYMWNTAVNEWASSSPLRRYYGRSQR